MSSTLIIYKSKTGFTKKYADYLSNELDCDSISLEKVASKKLSDYDTIIFASSLHAGKVISLAWFKKQIPKLEGKKFALLITGLMPEDAPMLADSIKNNVSPEEQKALPVFYARGGLDYEHMGFIDKLMMAGLKTAMKNAKDGDRALYETIATSNDMTSMEYLKPLLDYIKSVSL